MNLTYHRKMYRSDGIFSDVTLDESGLHFMCVLEHAFPQADGTFAPVLPAGTYKCVRGIHKLKNGIPFETFEITGIKGHSGVVFHKGNWNENSEACSLCGTGFAVGADPYQGGKQVEMVINSAIAFQDFMELQDGVDSFMLTVVA